MLQYYRIIFVVLSSRWQQFAWTRVRQWRRVTTWSTKGDPQGRVKTLRLGALQHLLLSHDLPCLHSIILAFTWVPPYLLHWRQPTQPPWAGFKNLITVNELAWRHMARLARHPNEVLTARGLRLTAANIFVKREVKLTRGLSSDTMTRLRKCSNDTSFTYDAKKTLPISLWVDDQTHLMGEHIKLEHIYWSNIQYDNKTLTEGETYLQWSKIHT